MISVFIFLIWICKSMEKVPQQVFPHFVQGKGPLAYLQRPTPEPHELITHLANLCRRSILIPSIHARSASCLVSTFPTDNISVCLLPLIPSFQGNSTLKLFKWLWKYVNIMQCCWMFEKGDNLGHVIVMNWL